MVLTGGIWAWPRVRRFGTQGWIEDLPDLIEERYPHGCGSYLRMDNTQVSIDYMVFLCVTSVTDVPGSWRTVHRWFHVLY